MGTRPQRGRRSPVRTCVACREEAGRADLVRIARRPDGAVAVDKTGREPGRGAYLHASPGCIELAQKRKLVDRALKVAVPGEVWQIL